jgi:general stress protein 26
MSKDTAEGVKKLAELIRGIKVAMLTTVAEDGNLRSRPMATQEAEFDGVLWFFTRAGAPKVGEVERDERVCVSYASPDDQRYVSVSGRAELVRDPAKVKELWGPAYKAWFPKGLDDPELALLRVEPERAEYWDAPSGTLVQIAGLAKSVVTGKPAAAGEHEKLDLGGGRGAS